MPRLVPIPTATGGLVTQFLVGLLLVLGGLLDVAAAEQPQLLSILTADDTTRQYHEFGTSVAVDGNTAMIGAPSHTVDGRYAAGAVYVFERTGDTWTQVQIMVPNDPLAYIGFGHTVVLEGDRAMVAAPDFAFYAGTAAVYVFERQDGAWVERQKLPAEPYYNQALAIDGDYALLGNANRGEVRVLQWVDAMGAWSVCATLVGAGIQPYDYSRFGGMLVLDGDRAVVSSGLESGTLHIFERGSGCTWSEVATLSAQDREAYLGLGAAIASQGDRLILGASVARIDGQRRGAVYVFERDARGEWVELDRLLPSSRSEFQAFGGALSVQGNRLVVGAPGRDLTYLFEWDGTAWSQSDVLFSPQRGISTGRILDFDGANLLLGVPRYSAATYAGSGAVFAYDVPVDNTARGNDVAVSSEDGAVNLSFDTVVTGGATTITEVTPGPDSGDPEWQVWSPGSGVTYYDIETTAQFEGSVQVCMDVEVDVSPLLKRFVLDFIEIRHFVDGRWEPLANRSLTEVADPLYRVCGDTDSFSLFAPFILVDIRPPEVECAIDRVSGSHEVSYAATDAVDAMPEVQVTLGCSSSRMVQVSDGERFEFDRDDDCEIEHDDGQLDIEGPFAELRVTATDMAGNITTCTSRVGHDDD